MLIVPWSKKKENDSYSIGVIERVIERIKCPNISEVEWSEIFRGGGYNRVTFQKKSEMIIFGPPPG